MKKKNVKKICKAVSLQLTILLIIGTMIQSGISAEINLNNEIIKNNNYQPLPKKEENRYMIWGKGQLNYLFPVNLENFSGEYSSQGNSYRIDGYISNTDIEVWNSVVRWFGGIKPQWALLFALRYKPIGFYFRWTLPKYFTIINYTGNICCNFANIPHGPAWTIYSLSGNADDIIKLY